MYICYSPMKTLQSDLKIIILYSWLVVLNPGGGGVSLSGSHISVRKLKPKAEKTVVRKRVLHKMDVKSFEADLSPQLIISDEHCDVNNLTSISYHIISNFISIPKQTSKSELNKSYVQQETKW